MKRVFAIVIIFLTFTQTISAQKLADLERVEPSFWWVGFKNHQLQLIVHGNEISQREVQIDYSGVSLKSVEKVENPNYMFLNLLISDDAQPGKFDIIFSLKGKKNLIYSYQLKARNKGTLAQGVTDKDLIYLIMPDRFANGNYSNDKISGLKDQTFSRDSMYYRHGGDIQGIIDHLDYLKDLGATALWLTPVQENDEFKTSYHGYANTENYKIDPRYGTNELYKKLVEDAHQKEMKIVMDVVPNHVGSQHWTVLDKPFKDWVHQWPSFTRTTYKDQTLFDPHASAADKKLMQNGWFDYHMPDMNQENQMVANYIEQSYIFWIEYAGVDGFRIDTYPYNNLEFMAHWQKRVKDEYPNFTLYGETYVHGMANQAYFTQGKTVNQKIDTELPATTDFQVHFSLLDALNQKFGWTEGVNELYTVLASDYLYQDAYRNVIFLDNHDITRFYSGVGEDFTKFKSGLAMLLTLRGVPQIYYGTELAMPGVNNPDGLLRADFLGGWKADQTNKFTSSGRTSKENEAFNYIKTLANYRKNTPALQTGKMMQYVPVDGIYVYFRYDNDKTVMVIYNGNDEVKNLDLKRFDERTNGFTGAKEITNGKLLGGFTTIVLPARTAYVYELTK
ncbi:MAG: glycoside hydrolase family 13 protein [Bacteroidetes bacterium]|nr:glycoside hydrolase family 13 protein [Bacteroidota bacterium]MBU1373247.1 glycoside hydrolase family 13 protein [Bacteroidota bacterium]MBU1486319.1 glycoside hydrolase family 13 protein [Bacteroidota bacterium]MBU1760297.1 glycoside hydrolase family 13 protein [Bacteroidota bacterium]MBU2269277.1 glycoside hydrolase family 13 protein [Bacteroidota bacterium]